MLLLHLILLFSYLNDANVRSFQFKIVPDKCTSICYLDDTNVLSFVALCKHMYLHSIISKWLDKLNCSVLSVVGFLSFLAISVCVQTPPYFFVVKLENFQFFKYPVFFYTVYELMKFVLKNKNNSKCT